MLLKPFDNPLSCTVVINDIFIRKEAQVGVRTQKRVVARQPDTPLRQMIAADPMTVLRPFLVTVFVTLIDENCIRLQIHFLCQRLDLLIQGGNQNLQFHEPSPLFLVIVRQFTRAIRNTIECTLRGHSIVMNRIFDAFRCFAAPFCS